MFMRLSSEEQGGEKKNQVEEHYGKGKWGLK